MDVLNELSLFHNKIQDAKAVVSSLEYKRIAWCKENREQIKKLYPKRHEIYEIIDIKNGVFDIYCADELTDDVYFFKTTHPIFDPKREYEYRSNVFPSAGGVILDSNLKEVRHGRVIITNLKQIEKGNSIEISRNKFTKIYVMIDKNTSYYKIGRSKKPLIRERTLQSEKPTIEILHVFDGRIKNESELHRMFSDKRIRGEWFDLSGSDIERIKDFFNGIYF